MHVTPDVALFVKQFCQLTRNTSALRELFPLLEGVADFVVSRVNRTDDQGWLSVENIVAPDESTGRNDVNNDIFTNAVGVLALETTLDAASRLGLSVSQRQISSWRHAAAKLKLQLETFDGHLLHKEYDQYTFSTSTVDTKVHGKKVHPTIGQGDTVLLGFPLQFNASHRLWGGHKDEVRLNDISYYGPRVSPTGSYMTAGHCKESVCSAVFAASLTRIAVRRHRLARAPAPRPRQCVGVVCQGPFEELVSQTRPSHHAAA